MTASELETKNGAHLYIESSLNRLRILQLGAGRAVVNDVTLEPDEATWLVTVLSDWLIERQE